ncbi:MAG: aminopeptidase P N-terminal domain-containing protein [Gammaproteobacteria bacterium SHHR-1]|nr:aminopeptidase P N-terminal domain-containing protein [gamma proteobacterium SS-5]
MHKEYASRRRRLLQQLGKQALAIIPTAPTRLRNNDVEHPFRPDSDFFYLTGFTEPEAIALLLTGKRPNFILFCRERDPKLERWNGLRAGLEGARKLSGADQVFAIEEFEQRLPQLLEGRRRLYYAIGSHALLDRLLPQGIRRLQGKGRGGAQVPESLHNLDLPLHEMRLIKSPAEIELMRQAASISAQAHAQLMRWLRPGMMEYQLAARFEHECQQQGARRQAYPAIVAGGANACILHYTDNDCPLRAGDLVLVDAGGEYQGYAADITRTFPVNGRFSPEQRALYELVLQAQQAAIEQVRPGNPCNAPHEAAVQVLCRGLVKLGLLKGPASRQLKRGGHKRFFMHRTGHWLGLDVHDLGSYQQGDDWRCLEAGMVLTVEPALYIDADDKKVDKRWRGIGIRIEDDVLVTAEGHQILSQEAPKQVDEIESWMAQGQVLKA